MTETIKVKVLIALPYFKVGDVYDVAVDSEGTPLCPKWRRRLYNAKVDKSFEIAVEKAPLETKITNRSVEETK